MSTALVPRQKNTAAIQGIAGRALMVKVKSPEIVKVPNEKAFKITGVQYSEALNIEAPTMKYSVHRSKSTPSEFLVKFKPDGSTHQVNCSYLNVPFAKFELHPAPVTLSMNHKDKEITLDNVYDTSKLLVESATLPFSISKDGEHGAKIKYQPENNSHDVKISYNGKLVEGGNFRLAPKTAPPTQQAQYMHQQPQIMMPQQQMMMPQQQMMQPQQMMMAQQPQYMMQQPPMMPVQQPMYAMPQQALPQQYMQPMNMAPNVQPMYPASYPMQM